MLITLNDITIRDGEQQSFEHTNWKIATGQHWAVIGSTGSGKSTLVKAISRKLPLQHGQIFYHFDETEPNTEGRSFLHPNEILTFSSEAHQDFLRRFSQYHQARWQSFEGEEVPTVSDLLYKEATAAAFVTAEQERIYQEKRERVIAQFGLETLLTRKVHLLSHGESRKTFLARLLLRSPRLLILDDPFIGLDQKSRERFRMEISQLLQFDDPALLIVTSRLEEIPEGIGYLLLVKDHRVIAQGRRDQVLAQNAAQQDLSFENTPTEQQKTSDLSRMAIRYSTALEANRLEDHQAMVQLTNVSVTYDDVQVLKQVNWTVRQGERWALLGANGAGKSTLLSLILADNPQAYTHSITLFGKKRGSGESIWEIKRKIGWVSPELHVFYERSFICLDVVCSGFFDSVGLYRRCTADQRATAEGWINALGMEQLSTKLFFNLSTGQQRLALLARALVKNPLLLILDEPCQGLDRNNRQVFLNMIEDICRQAPVTLIYVSHYQDEIPGCITCQLKLERGEVAGIQ